MKIIQPIRKFIAKKVMKKLVSKAKQPGRQKLLGQDLYSLARKIAAFVGVNPIFLKRANEIHKETESDQATVAFLDILINLTLKREKPNLIYDLPARLETDEEREALRTLLETNLADAEEPMYAAALQGQLLRLDEANVDNIDIKNYIRQTVQGVIQRRLENPVQSRIKHFSNKDAYAALTQINELFRDAGKRFFLDRGTLLGAIRENGFIASDYDIDLGVLESDISLDEVREIMSDSSFALVQECPWKLAYTSDQNIQVDFFLTRSLEGSYVSRGMNEIHQWNFQPFDLEQRKLLGGEYFIPSNPENHLTQIYGNWETPNLFYDLSFDEFCVTYSPNLNSAMYLMQRFANGVKKRNRFDVERCLKALASDFDVDFTDFLASGERVKGPVYGRKDRQF